MCVSICRSSYECRVGKAGGGSIPKPLHEAGRVKEVKSDKRSPAEGVDHCWPPDADCGTTKSADDRHGADRGKRDDEEEKGEARKRVVDLKNEARERIGVNVWPPAEGKPGVGTVSNEKHGGRL